MCDVSISIAIPLDPNQIVNIPKNVKDALIDKECCFSVMEKEQ